jgi:hypothetical protein
MAVVCGLVCALGIAAAVDAAAVRPRAVRARWHLVANRVGYIGTNGRYVLYAQTPPSGLAFTETVINTVTGQKEQLSPPPGCSFPLTGVAFGGSWVVARCGGYGLAAVELALYDISHQNWTLVAPNLKAIYSFNADCATGDPNCEWQVGIGAHWLAFSVDCGYHCADSSTAFQNLRTGEVLPAPAGWKPGGHQIPDLDSVGLVRSLCKPLTVPTGPTDPYTDRTAPGVLEFAGPFAVASAWSGHVNQQPDYVLERCGTRLHQLLATASGAYFPPGVTSRAVVWPGSGTTVGTIQGLLLPSRRRFALAAPRAASGSRAASTTGSAFNVALTKYTLFVLLNDGRLYDTPAPTAPK